MSQFGAGKDWVKANWELVRCRASNSADAFFSMWSALETITDGSIWASALPIYNGYAAVQRMYGCSVPSKEETEDFFNGGSYQCQCAAVSGQLFLEFKGENNKTFVVAISELEEAKEISRTSYADGEASCTWISVAGLTTITVQSVGLNAAPRWYIKPKSGTGCCDDVPPLPPLPKIPDDYIFDDYANKCGHKVQLLDSAVDKFGSVWNFYYVFWNHRECGGISEGFLYWESHLGPYIYDFSDGFWGFPSSPPYGCPHPHAPKNGGGGGCSISGLNKVSYFLDAGCTWNEEKEEFDTRYEYEVETNEDGILGLARRMDALAWMINNSGLIPYTVCADNKPEKEGTWVSTRWVSDGDSDNGRDRLRKLFRYRSKSTRTPEQLREYWSSFTWKAGSTIVIHKGGWWGVPQVWAKNEDEGKRVIRFAGGEAGIDPDSVGEWIVTTTDDPRYGMSDTMRLAKPRGEYWVTRRDGPSGNVL